MLELALHYGARPLQLKRIAESQGISLKYLEQLMALLKASGFVNTVRGAKGGYVLARPPDMIKLSDCVNCLEGHIALVECVDDESFCSKATDCLARQLWQQVSDAIENVLQSVTLQDLVEKAKKSATLNYQI
jgi:Rrf2 family protein